MLAWPDAMGIVAAPDALDGAVGLRDDDAGDVDDGASGQARADTIVVAPDEIASAPPWSEKIQRAVLRAPVTEIAEVPDGVIGTDDRVPVLY